MDPATLIKRLNLASHPEGGHYRRVYSAAAAPGQRPLATAIFYLLAGDDCSTLHRLDADELWHYHAGCGLHLHCFEPDGSYRRHALGMDLDAGAVPQIVIPAYTWFGATLLQPQGWCLAGCSVHPGFEWSGFEVADRAVLTARFPEQRAVIEALTRT